MVKTQKEACYAFKSNLLKRVMKLKTGNQPVMERKEKSKENGSWGAWTQDSAANYSWSSGIC